MFESCMGRQVLFQSATPSGLSFRKFPMPYESRSSMKFLANCASVMTVASSTLVQTELHPLCQFISELSDSANKGAHGISHERGRTILK